MLKLAKRLGIFGICYFGILLLLQITPVRSLYVGLYNTLQETVFNILHPTVHVDFEKYQSAHTDMTMIDFDYTVSVAPALEPHKPIAKINQRAGKTAIVPFALLLALLLSGSSSIKRKLMAGMIITLLILIITAMQYTSLIHTNAPALSGPTGNTWLNISSSLYGLYRTHEAMYVIIFALWSVLCITKEDIQFE